MRICLVHLSIFRLYTFLSVFLSCLFTCVSISIYPSLSIYFHLCLFAVSCFLNNNVGPHRIHARSQILSCYYDAIYACICLFLALCSITLRFISIIICLLLHVCQCTCVLRLCAYHSTFFVYLDGNKWRWQHLHPP